MGESMEIQLHTICIRFLNFLFVNQDGPEQKAVLACMVHCEKALNRQNHNLQITKLSDMKVQLGFSKW